MDFKNRNTIVNFSNSILYHFGCNPFHSPIPEIDRVLEGHKKVVVCLFDGMGRHIIERHKKLCPTIYANRIHFMESTFPPTTVAATTGFLTAKFPIETGWMSWTQYLSNLKRNVNVFRNTDATTFEQLAPIPGDSILKEMCPKKYIKTVINETRGQTIAYDMEDIFGKYCGPSFLPLARWKLNKFLKGKEECFVYYYYESPDHEIHGEGVDGKTVKSKIKSIDRFVKKIAKKNPDTLFLVIADHGLVDTVNVDIANYPDLLDTLSVEKPISFEDRNPTFFVKEGRNSDFELLFKKYYGAHYDLYTKEQIYKKHIFGDGAPNEHADSFIGDYMAIAIDENTLFDSRLNKKFTPIGRHAGGTAQEREISVSAFNK